MAKRASSTKVAFGRKSKGHKGVHAKTKNSWNKNSKNYVKPHKGQGR